LVDAAQKLQSIGRQSTERAMYLERVFAWFHDQVERAERKTVKDRLSSGTVDEQQAVELLRRLQSRTATAPTAN